MAMTGSFLRGGAKKSDLRAVITRANGTVEDLGVIAYWHRNPIIRWSWAAHSWLKRNFK